MIRNFKILPLQSTSGKKKKMEKRNARYKSSFSIFLLLFVNWYCLNNSWFLWLHPHHFSFFNQKIIATLPFLPFWKCPLSFLSLGFTHLWLATQPIKIYPKQVLNMGIPGLCLAAWLSFASSIPPIGDKNSMQTTFAHSKLQHCIKNLQASLRVHSSNR